MTTQLLEAPPVQTAARPAQGTEAAPTFIRLCRRSQISPDPLQPRQHFDEAKMNELVESFRQHGFNAELSHLLVRETAHWKIEHDTDSKHWFIKRSLPPLLVDAACGGKPKEEWETAGTAESAAAATKALDDLREYELINGERRWRAAGIVGLELVPFVVTEMSDREVLELQLVDNLQRADLNAMEEAEGYRRLIEMGATQQEIADKVGLSRHHVERCLTLCKLAGSPAGDAIATGKITPRHGRIISRVPSSALRQELLEKIFNPPDGSAPPWSSESLEIHVGLDYVRSLKQAKFDKEDPSLVPLELAPEVGGQESAVGEESSRRLWGGACTDCPFNTAVNPQEKRSAKDSSAMCTNPECFRMKEVATHERWQKEMAKEGKFVLSPAENAELWDESGKRLAHNSPYIELDERPAPSEVRAGLSDDAWQSWDKLIGETYVPTVLGRDTAGQVHKLAVHDLAKKAAHLNGHQIFRDSAKERRTDNERSSTADRPAPKTEADHAAETLETKQEREAKAAVSIAEVSAIVAAAEGKVRRRMLQIPKPFWSVAAASLLDTVNEASALERITGRREYELDEGSFAKLSLGELFGLVVECLVVLSDNPEAWAKVFEVKLAKVRKAAEKAAAKGSKE